MDAFLTWCASNSASAKCTRTIFQGIVGAIIAYLPDLVAGGTIIPNEYKALVVALAMAVLSPIQAQLAPSEVDPESGAGSDDLL